MNTTSAPHYDHTAGFGNDPHIKSEIAKLIAKYNIKNIIETGTYLGDTTAQLAKLAKHLYTIEISKQFYWLSGLRLVKLGNVKRYLGNSPQVLKKILPEVKKPILFYLDAHWHDYWPILEEIEAIATKSGAPNILVIHDFFVPNSHLGYDSYIQSRKKSKRITIFRKIDFATSWLSTGFNEKVFRKQKLDLAYIRDKLSSYYSRWDYHFNKKAAGEKRGVIYIECHESSSNSK